MSDFLVTMLLMALCYALGAITIVVYCRDTCTWASARQHVFGQRHGMRSSLVSGERESAATPADARVAA